MMIYTNNLIATAARKVTCSTLLTTVTDLLKHNMVIRNIAFSTSIHCLITLVLKSIKYKNTIVSLTPSFFLTSQKSYVAVQPWPRGGKVSCNLWFESENQEAAKGSWLRSWQHLEAWHKANLLEPEKTTTRLWRGK